MENLQDNAFINIAFCGRTNSGKTSLITTIRDEWSGEIRDESSTTKEVSCFSHPSFNVNLYDFPGFEKIGLVEAYIKVQREEMELADRLKGTILSDEQAIREYSIVEELRKMDVVVFVCNLETVPDAGHRSEIKIIKHFNKKTIGVISKLNSKEQEQRKMQWENCLREENITDIISFNAHFDSPVKVLDFFNSVNKYITN